MPDTVGIKTWASVLMKVRAKGRQVYLSISPSQTLDSLPRRGHRSLGERQQLGLLRQTLERRQMSTGASLLGCFPQMTVVSFGVAWANNWPPVFSGNQTLLVGVLEEAVWSSQESWCQCPSAGAHREARHGLFPRGSGLQTQLIQERLSFFVFVGHSNEN